MKKLQKKLSILLINVILVNSSYAFQTIKAGQPAPFDGVIMTNTQAKQVETDLVKLDFTLKELEHRKSLEDAFKQRISLSEQQIETYKTYNFTLEDRLQKSREENKWDRVIWFSLGLLGTAASIKLGQELSNQ